MNSLFCVFLWFLAFVCSTPVKSAPSCFTSISKLSQLHDIEGRILQLIQKLKYDETLASYDIIYKFLDYYQKSEIIKGREASIPTPMHHPLNAYFFTKRIVHSLNPIVEELNAMDDPPLVLASMRTETNTLQETLNCWPNEDDLAGLTDGLVRLVKVYHIPKRNFIAGYVFNYRSIHSFQLTEIMNLVVATHKAENYRDEIEWCRILTTDYEEQLTANGLQRQVFRMLASALYELGDLQGSINELDTYLDANPDDDSVTEDRAFYENKMTSGWSAEKVKYAYDEVFNNYEYLCRTALKPARHGLHCHISRPMNGWYFIKSELLSTSPVIKIIYDVIFDDEINYIRAMSLRLMSRSKVFKSPTNDREYVSTRISETGWLNDEFFNDTVLIRLSKRLELITGMDARVAYHDSSAEPYQVLNYGFAGMYEPHYDYYPQDALHGPPSFLTNSGNRIATFIYYLSDVELGGSTVFPTVNVAVPPRKGAAALWYNIRRNGIPDNRTQHAGCPVLLGSKWISNKWIHERGQMFRRRCAINKLL